MTRRVVVTGCGVVSPVGNNVDTFWDSLCKGESGIDLIRAFDVSAYPSRIAGEIRDIDFSSYVESKEVNRLDRCILFAMAAADMAIKQSGLELEKEDKSRIGTIIGSGIGGLRTLEKEHEKLLSRGPSRVSPFLIPMMICDMAAGRVAIQYGLTGPNYAAVSACASGSHALGEAFMNIQHGTMDIAVAGGTEATISPLALGGFCSMKALSTRNNEPKRASRPFDAKRDGFVMSEGAGLVILEELEHARARKATIYGELLGYGASADAYHLSHPAPEGTGAQSSMRRALSSAGLQPHDIDYINAHGTSTGLNDKYESYAIQQVFKENASELNVSSTKSMTGHLLGASGGIEFISTILSLYHGIIPPTINYEEPDPECGDLNFTPNEAVKRPIRYALSNSFGFGGHNATLAVGTYESPEYDN